MSSLILQTASVGPWPMNTYAIICPDTQESVLIDPGAEPETLAAMLGDSTPLAILLTHAHRDHVGALEEMKAQLKVPVYIHPAEGFRDSVRPRPGQAADALSTARGTEPRRNVRREGR